MVDTALRYALIGKSGSGKSEVARILQAETSCQIIKTGVICRQISNLLFGNEDKRSTQILDDALTAIDGSIFLRASLRNFDTRNAFVIDSLRFNTDLNLALDLKCKTIRLLADDEIRVRRLRERGQAYSLDIDGEHRSEMELDDARADFVITNNGNFGDLKERVIKALRTP